MTSAELQERLKQFAYKAVKVCGLLSFSKLSKIIEDQLLRSAFSAAANYRAACRSQSKRAFIAKLSIALEEIDESLFWLEAISDLKLVAPDILLPSLKESEELTRILAASRKTMQQKQTS